MRLTDANFGSGYIRGVGSSPFESLLPFAERAHLNSLAVAERVDIGKARVNPVIVNFQSDSTMNEENNLVAGDNESFRLACFLGPGVAPVRSVCRHFRMSAKRPGTRIMRRLDPRRPRSKNLIAAGLSLRLMAA